MGREQREMEGEKSNITRSSSWMRVKEEEGVAVAVGVGGLQEE